MISNSLKHSLKSQDIPHKYEMIYTDQVDGYSLIYNPLSRKGLVVLQQSAAFYYSLIDGRRTLSDIFKLAQREDSRIMMDDVFQFFDQFLKSEIIFFKEEDKLKLPVITPPKGLNVWFHITNQCNLRCKYCYIRKSSKRMDLKIANKAIKKIYLTAVTHKIKYILFTFMGGEPLLEFPKIRLLIKKIRELEQKYKIHSRINLISNGTLINAKIAGELKKLNISVQISCDGFGRYNDKTRVFPNGSGSFKFIKRGMENLQKMGIRFGVIIVVTSKNIKGVPEFVEYLLSQKIRFGLNLFRDNPLAKSSLMCEKRDLIKTFKRMYKEISLNPPNFSILNHIDKISFNSPTVRICSAGSNYIGVRQDGKLASCQMTMDRVIGSISDKDLLETVRKGSFIKPASMTVEDRAACRKCLWKYACGGGCPFFVYQSYGRYDAKSHYCDVYRALIPEIFRIEAKRIIGNFSKSACDQ